MIKAVDEAGQKIDAILKEYGLITATEISFPGPMTDELKLVFALLAKYGVVFKVLLKHKEIPAK